MHDSPILLLQKFALSVLSKANRAKIVTVFGEIMQDYLFIVTELITILVDEEKLSLNYWNLKEDSYKERLKREP